MQLGVVMFLRGVFLVLFLCGTVQAQTQLKELEQELSDSVITTKITAKFTQNTRLNPLKISVNTQDGIVSLEGSVPSKRAFADAVRLAVHTHGVSQVETEKLRIEKVNTVFVDAWITAKVEMAVLKAKLFDDGSIPLAGIKASTNNGVVKLSGNLANADALSILLKRIDSLHGVKKIISHIHVKKL